MACAEFVTSVVFQGDVVPWLCVNNIDTLLGEVWALVGVGARTLQTGGSTNSNFSKWDGPCGGGGDHLPALFASHPASHPLVRLDLLHITAHGFFSTDQSHRGSVCARSYCNLLLI